MRKDVHLSAIMSKTFTELLEVADIFRREMEVFCEMNGEEPVV